jgi:hypothetical protein
MKSGVAQKVLSTAVALVAIALLILGSRRYYTVRYDKAPDLSKVVTGGPQAGPAPMVQSATQEISDRDLVENATFTGVTRLGEDLYFTYDPSQPRGKQACPT